MERIQKALEKADRQREQESTAKRGPADSHHSGLYKVTYTRTRVVDVPEEVFRQNRVIAAIPQHDLKDAYRMLRTRVLQSMRSQNWNSLAITGPASGCGKTLTAINLAISLAMEVTNTVLLVDLDLRKPSVHKYFGYEPQYGLGDYLFNDIPIEEILFSPSIERLVVLPGKEGIHNSSEMLRSPKMLALVDELKTRYPDRYVVVDLPPILAADDALAFSPYVDAMLLVAEDGSTKVEHLEKSLEVLRNAQIIGTVLNRAAAPTAGYGYYNAELPVKPKPAT